MYEEERRKKEKYEMYEYESKLWQKTSELWDKMLKCIHNSYFLSHNYNLFW